MYHIILFLPLTFTAFVRRVQNTFRKIRVTYVMCIIRDKSIIGFFKFPFGVLLAVTLVYISIKWYAWQETLREL